LLKVDVSKLVISTRKKKSYIFLSGKARNYLEGGKNSEKDISTKEEEKIEKAWIFKKNE